MRVLSYLIVTLVVLTAHKLLAQHFPSKQYMISDGMPSNSIYDIAQTEDGMMWFITKAGPAYYDTREWHVFPDSLNLPTSTNSKIRAYGDRIWVAGLNNTSLTVQHYREKWTDIGFPTMNVDVNGPILFDVKERGDQFESLLGFKEALYIFSSVERAWQSIPLPEGLLLYNVQVIDTTFYLATSQGLFEYSRGTLQKIPLPYERLPSNLILCLDYQDDVYYLLGLNWFAEVTTDSVIYTIPDAGLNPSSKWSKSSVVVTDELVLFGANTPARLINRKERTFQDLLIDGKLVNIGSTKIMEDREGTIWVGDTRGLFKFNLLQFENYNKNSGLSTDEVTTVYQLENGEMMLANPNHLNILKDGVVANYEILRTRGQTYRILDIQEDVENNNLIIAGNDGGLRIYQRTQYNRPIRVITDQGRMTTVEAFNDKIYAAGSQGLFELKDKDLIPLSKETPTIRNLSVLNDKLGVYTTGRGMYIYDGTDMTYYSSRNFGLNSIYDGVVYDGKIVLASRDGLATLSGEQIVHWDGLHINSPVYALMVDRHDHLWIGSDHGVYHYDGVRLELFDMDEGLLGNEANRNGLIEDAKGQVWIGTEKGVSVFKGEHSKRLNISLSVKITDIIVDNDRSILQSGAQELSYDENNLVVSFRCLSYVDELKTNFRYRIKSTEDQWVHLSNTEGTITLNNLDQGDYQFEIQARFGEGEWGPSTVFPFKIQRPYFYSWWFILIIAVLLAAVARVIFYFRYLLLIRKQQTLKALIAERTKEIQDLNEHLEEKVKERTKELQDKNMQLEEYAFINAHLLRAPLAKIMSAVHVVEKDDQHHVDTQVLKILKASVDELDQVIYSINDILREE